MGLDLRGAYEEGMVFRRDALAIDDVHVRARVTEAARGAFNLAMFVTYPAKVTIRPLLALAHRKALGLAVKSGFPTKESVKPLLAKAYAEMLVLAGRASEALDDDLRSRLGGSSGPPQAKAPPKEKEEQA